MGWFGERFVTVQFEKVDLKPRFFFSNAAAHRRKWSSWRRIIRPRG